MRTSPNPTWVILYELVAFSILLNTIWTTGLMEVLSHDHASMEWEGPILETTVLLLVAIPTVVLTRRIVSRLHYLEGFLRLCAWCHRVECNGQWLSIEEFLKRRLSTRTSHGICESCNKIIRNEIQARRKALEDQA